MGRHTGGQKGYRFARRICPGCGANVAVSWDPDGHTAWLRRHHDWRYGTRCSWRSVDTDRIPLSSPEEADRG